MEGGYASAARWNAHFSEQEQKAGERARAAIDARRDEIARSFPQGATWSDYYDWMKANLPQEQHDMYHYGAGRALESSQTWVHFRAIVGEKRQEVTA
jgi:hypothetical protein